MPGSKVASTRIENAVRSGPSESRARCVWSAVAPKVRARPLGVPRSVNVGVVGVRSTRWSAMLTSLPEAVRSKQIAKDHESSGNGKDGLFGSVCPKMVREAVEILEEMLAEDA